MAIDNAVEIFAHIAFKPLLDMATQGVADIDVLACDLDLHVRVFLPLACGPGRPLVNS